MSTLNQVALLLKDHLESFEAFDAMTWLIAKPKDIGAQIDEALAKLNIVGMIIFQKGATDRNDLDGPVLNDCEFLIRILQNITLDDSGLDALDIAEEVVIRCHNFVLDEERQVMLRCTRDTISLGDDVGNEQQPCISFDIPIQFHVVLPSEWEQVDTPVIVYDDAGRVQMSCPTPGAQIFYTTNGLRPNPQNGTVYTTTLEEIADASVIQARAYLHGMLVSETATAQPGEVTEELVTIQQIIAALNALGGNMRLSATGNLIIQTDDEVVENRTLHQVKATKLGTDVSVVADPTEIAEETLP